VGRIITGCIGGGIALYIVALAINVTVSARKPVKNPLIADLAHQKDVTSRFDSTADSYDSEVATQEFLMGIRTKRDRLAKMCKGHVLEVSCGTGRNLGFFDIGLASEVDSLTFVDLSPQMIDVCKKKWDVLYASEKKNLKPGLQVRFMTGSALDAMPSPPGGKEKKYDTILQTLGLCSTPLPVKLLTNLATHLNTSNPDARILLLEHGRSYRDWLNNIIDNTALEHAEKHGCWANRDIGALVAEAATKAGLEVVREKRWHLGTTWVIELKAKEGSTESKEERERKDDAEKQLTPKKSSGWFG
jgi:methyltransferase OMS1